MKILYFALVELDIPSGPSVHTINLMKGFKEIGANAILFCPLPRETNKKLSAIDHVFIRFFGFSTLRLFIFNLLSFFKLLKIMMRFTPDILYVRDRPGNIVAYLCSKIKRVPLFIEMNGITRNDFSLSETARIHRYIRDICFKGAEGLIFNCSKLRDKYCMAYKIPKKKTEVITMHVDSDLFKPMDQEKCKSDLDIPPKRLTIGYIGGFNPRHDVQILVEILDELIMRKKDAGLLLVGKSFDDNLMNSFRYSKHSDRIFMPGWVSHEELPRYINAMDVGAAFWKNLETNRPEVSVKLKEYLACSIPVICNSEDENLFKEYPENSIINIENSIYSRKNVTLIVDIILNSLTNKLDRKKCSEFISGNYCLSKAARQTFSFFKIKTQKRRT